MTRLRMATRASALARAQSGAFARELMRACPGLEIETVEVRTSGDAFSLAPKGAPNVKAMFIKEIEEALASGEADFGVHSAKDLPADLLPGMRIAAYPRREDPRDCFVPGSCPRWADLAPGATLGTASLRRQVQLGAAKSLAFVPLRGNVDTRLRKLEERALAGIVLAEAGLKRLGLDIARETLPAEVIVPAPGQGALAVECAAARGEVAAVLALLDDPDARLEVEVERSLLRALGGGCSTPFGALARARGDEVRVWAFWSKDDGSSPMRVHGRSSRRPEELASLVSSFVSRLSR